jgi:DNA mismatch endonuclease, patch repair protein
MVVSKMEPEAKRLLMGRFRGKNTRPEMLVRRLLHRLGYRFRLHRRDLPGRPDIVLPRYKTAIFVHGCFWHHHTGCPTARIPGTSEQFWKAKFAATQERDRKSTERLREQGWHVIILWECEVLGSNLQNLLLERGLTRMP